MPDVNIAAFCTGAISLRLFEEARYCFVYGQYLASILLALSFIEQSLAGYFYGIGRNDLERAKLTELAGEAKKYLLISADEFLALKRAWDLRKPLTHFRPPGHHERIEARRFAQKDQSFETMLEKDAKQVIVTMLRLQLKITPWSASTLPKTK